jgi:hypothetical protein
VYPESGGIYQNCTIIGNSAPGAGGVRLIGSVPSLENCIIVSNSPDNYTFNASPTNYNNCCSVDMNTAVSKNNIMAAPVFMNYAAGDYRLANISPCINTGTNREWMINALDLDEKERSRYGRVDMGAYERIHQGAVFGFH